MTTTDSTQHRSAAKPVAASHSRATGSRHATTGIRRSASAALLVLVAVLAAPHPASALVPIPPAPVRFPIADIGHAILTLAEQYTQSPLPEKGRLHHELALLINTGHEAL